MVETTLEQELPAVLDLATRKAQAFVRRCGLGPDDRDDIRSQLLLSFLRRWSSFDAERASVRTFASRVMDKELVSILRYRLAASRREHEVASPAPAVSSDARCRFRIDLDRALSSLPPALQATAQALFWCSTLDAAEQLHCSRQMIHARKRQIRAALDSAGIGPRYFQAGGGM